VFIDTALNRQDMLGSLRLNSIEFVASHLLIPRRANLHLGPRIEIEDGLDSGERLQCPAGRHTQARPHILVTGADPTIAT
jgi:hypothetical protein